MDSVADDYSWFFGGDSLGEFGEQYSCTVTRDLAALDVVERVGGQVVRPASFAEVSNSAEFLDLEPDLSYLAVAELGDHVLILESTSLVAYFQCVPLSQGTALASHFQSVDLRTGFRYLRDGVTLLDFEPFYGVPATVSDQDLVQAMRDAGLPDRDRYAEAAFALADRLIGTRLSLPVLEGAGFLWVSAAAT